jgi:LysM repeat protein
MLDGIWNKEGNQLTEVDLNFFRGTLEELRAMTHTGSIGGKEIVRPVSDDKKELPVEEKKEIPSKPDVPQGNFVKHIVKPGDTLLGIALKYKTTMNAILQINPQITNPNLIRDGETINIPPKK